MHENKDDYYKSMRLLALEKRQELLIETGSLGVREVRAIYRREKIVIDIRKLPSCLKAIYMPHSEGVSVAIRKDLPDEPKIFALVHELKHHWFDQSLIRSGLVRCGDYNANEMEEKGAEVFAAEFIYPELEFLADAMAFNSGVWQAEDIVRFKRTRCRAKVSYMYIRKRLERLSIIPRDQFKDVKFQKLEDQIYGVPFYRQPGFKHRKRIVGAP